MDIDRWRLKRTCLAAIVAILLFACSLPYYPQTLAFQSEEGQFEAGNWLDDVSSPDMDEQTSSPQDQKAKLFPGTILFKASRGGIHDNYTLRGDGEPAVKLTNDPAEEILVDCSPDHGWFVYGKEEEDGYVVEIMDLTGEQIILAAEIKGRELTGHWSEPDLIYLSTYDNQQNNLLYQLRRGGASWVLEEVQEEELPDLIYSQQKSGNDLLKMVTEYDGEVLDFEIALIEDGEETRLTENDGILDYFPIWSPDGSQILFSSMRDGNDFDLFLMDRNGTILEQLTSNDETDIARCWLPD